MDEKLPKNINAIILDIDRTITNRNGLIPYTIVSCLMELKDRIKIIFATGRKKHEIKDLVHTPFFNFIVYENGLGVYDAKTKRFMSHNHHILHDVRSLLEDLNLPYFAGENIISFKNKHPTANSIIDMLSEFSQYIDFSDNVDETMILPKGINKAGEVQNILKQLKINISSCIIIADGENDMPLFELGGFNIALQNSVAGLKEKAHITVNKKYWEGTLSVLRLM